MDEQQGQALSVKGPDGQVYHFPSDASDLEITEFFRKFPTTPTQAIKDMHTSNAAHGLEGPQAAATQKDQNTLNNVMDFASGRPAGISGAISTVAHPVRAATEFVKGAVGNPLETAKGLWDTASSIYKDPVRGTLAAAAHGVPEQMAKAGEDLKAGRNVEALGHGLGGIPVIGPPAAAAGERLATGKNVFGALGNAATTVGEAALPTLAKLPVEAVGGSRLATRAAEAMDTSAANRITKVMTPTTGPNKLRFGNMAADVAPAVAAEPGMNAFTKTGLRENIAGRLETAEAQLDHATDVRTRQLPVQRPAIMGSLQKKINDLQVPVGENQFGTPQAPIKPMPNTARIAVIQKAMDEIQALGPNPTYDQIKTIRQAYDNIARAGKKYTPSMTADYLSKSSEASGAADVTGVLRDNLAATDPVTARANKQYHIWKQADDVMQAAEETERVRPTVGRELAARTTGAIVGAVTDTAMGGHGLVGMTAGMLAGPSMDAALRAGPTAQIAISRALTNTAAALRTGEVASIDKAFQALRTTLMGANALANKQVR